MIGKVAQGITRQAAAGGTRSLPPKGRGSWEGYMHAAKAHIQMNNTGYLAKSAQNARSMPKGAPNLRIPTMNPLSMARRSSTNIYDSRMSGKNGSSVQRLGNLTRLNNMF